MSQLPTTSVQECQIILKKETLTKEDRFKLQRVQFRSLAGEYSDLSYNEIGEVNSLEEKNLYKIINATAILLGVYGEDVRQQVLGTRAISRLYSVSRDYSISEKDWERARFQLSIASILSEFSDNPKAWPVFDGKIPSRPFKFRQITAETWYKDIVSFLSIFTGNVLVKCGEEDAFAYICAVIAHHLHQTQPDRYPASSLTDENQAIHDILVAYIDRMGGNSSKIIRY